jgi:endonuclease YncB( thermonuclease family)
MMFSRRAWIFAIFVAVSPAVAGEISGAAHVIDGDTIEIGATKVRLFGIDAPESAQTCRAVVEKAYPCGEAATARVRQMTEGRPITCKGDEHDRYGRLLGVCSVGGVEINRTLVREGLAWAFVKYSRTYVPEEQEARRAKRGVFATENTPPWDFRAGRWGEAEKHALTREGCAIKGNVNRKGEHIYHMPWQRDYAKVNMDKGLGERWFCDEGEAEKAGWRRAAR